MTPWDPASALTAEACCARDMGFHVVADAVVQLSREVTTNPGGVVRGARAGARCVREALRLGCVPAAEAAAVLGVYERVAGVALSALMASPPVPPASELRGVARGLWGVHPEWSLIVELWADEVGVEPDRIADLAFEASVTAAFRADTFPAFRQGYLVLQSALARVARVAGDHALRLEVA